jgi:hypothetical protein
MTTQPEAARVERGPITEVKRFALGMADLLERQGFTVAANELRRLHAQRDALLEALVLLVASIENNVGPTFLPLQRARAVIAKAEENT